MYLTWDASFLVYGVLLFYLLNGLSGKIKKKV